jgi:hypothetical protein
MSDVQKVAQFGEYAVWEYDDGTRNVTDGAGEFIEPGDGDLLQALRACGTTPREYHAILTMQWPIPSGFNCTTVERTFTTPWWSTREALFRDMRAIAADAAVQAGTPRAKADGGGSVVTFTCEPNQL